MSWREKKSVGVSIIEVLLMLSLLCVTMVAFYMVMSQTGQNARGIYLQSSRSILLDRLKDEGNVVEPNYATLFTDTSDNKAVTESGQVLAFMRKVDTINSGASTSFQKTLYTYLYNNSTDAANAARYQTTTMDTTNCIYIDNGGSGSSFTFASMDGSRRFWIGGDYLYNSNLDQAGEATAYTTGSTISTIVNTSNQTVYQTNRYSTSGETFEFNVDNLAVNNLLNGDYTVKLLFAETNASTNATTNRRLMDISIQGTPVISMYSPYESTGVAYSAQILEYDAYVSNGVLTITIAEDAKSNQAAFVSGIIIKRRTTL